MNNFIKSTLFLLGILSLTSCVKKVNTASVNISSIGQENDSILINFYPYDQPESNIIKLKLNGGLLNIDTLITAPHFGTIMFPTILENGKPEYTFSQKIDFLIKPKEKIKIIASFDKNGFNYTVKGNNFNNQLEKYHREIGEETEKISAIYREIYNRFPNGDDWTLPGIDSLLRQVQSYKDAIEYKKESFIQANLKYQIAAYLMYYYPKEKVQELFPLLSEEAKRSTYGKLVAKKLNFWTSLSNGALAPNFHYKTSKNKEISLEMFKGKYVLLDFWGTWCSPCRQDIPALKVFYEAHKDNLEVIGIACNDKYETWKNLITEEEMNWTQIFNTPQKEDLTKTFDITVFPSKILIGPDGKILQTIKGSGKETFDQLNNLIPTH